MRYATYYPEEGKLALMSRRKTDKVAKCLDLMEEVWDQLNVVAIAKAKFFKGKVCAVLIKRGVKAPAFNAPPPVVTLTDEQFLAKFPKGMHAAMKATAKRCGAGIQDIFDNAHQEPDDYFGHGVVAWWVDLKDGWDCEDDAVGSIHERTIKDCLPVFKTIRKSEA